MKDFYDIAVIARRSELDGALLARACAPRSSDAARRCHKNCRSRSLPNSATANGGLTARTTLRSWTITRRQNGQAARRSIPAKSSSRNS